MKSFAAILLQVAAASVVTYLILVYVLRLFPPVSLLLLRRF